jgi:predicted RNA binding protein YcfA (HicA-like mRNA interferase family)
MARQPRVTARERIRRLERDGWYPARQAGGHVHFQHSTKRGTVTVPVHCNRILIAPVLTSTLRQAGLSAEEFSSL